MSTKPLYRRPEDDDEDAEPAPWWMASGTAKPADAPDGAAVTASVSSGKKPRRTVSKRSTREDGDAAVVSESASASASASSPSKRKKDSSKKKDKDKDKDQEADHEAEADKASKRKKDSSKKKDKDNDKDQEADHEAEADKASKRKKDSSSSKKKDKRRDKKDGDTSGGSSNDDDKKPRRKASRSRDKDSSRLRRRSKDPTATIVVEVEAAPGSGSGSGAEPNATEHEPTPAESAVAASVSRDGTEEATTPSAPQTPTSASAPAIVLSAPHESTVTDGAAVAAAVAATTTTATTASEPTALEAAPEMQAPSLAPPATDAEVARDAVVPGPDATDAAPSPSTNGHEHEHEHHHEHEAPPPAKSKANKHKKHKKHHDAPAATPNATDATDAPDAPESTTQPPPSVHETDSNSAADVESHRRFAINEIIASEKDYVQDLEGIVNGFLLPLREAEVPDLPILFSNIELLLSVHQNIVKNFEARIGAEVCDSAVDIGDIFIEMANNLLCYDQYCSNYVHAIDVLIKLNKNTTYSAEIEKCQEKYISKRGVMRLEDLLIKPVQRVCKYPLLFREVLKNTPTTHGDYESIESVLNRLEVVTASVNARKSEAERVRKMAEIRAHVDGAENKLDGDDKRLIYEGFMSKINPRGKVQSRYFILLNDSLIWCKPKAMKKNRYQFKGSVSLQASIVRDASDKGENRFELINLHTKKIYALVAESPYSKKIWMEHINTLISAFLNEQKLERMGGSVTSVVDAEAHADGVPVATPTGAAGAGGSAAAGTRTVAERSATVSAATEVPRPSMSKELMMELTSLREQNAELRQRVAALEKAVENSAADHQAVLQRLAALEALLVRNGSDKDAGASATPTQQEQQ